MEGKHLLHDHFHLSNDVWTRQCVNPAHCGTRANEKKIILLKGMFMWRICKWSRRCAVHLFVY
jgi:hypothetical protein